MHRTVRMRDSGPSTAQNARYVLVETRTQFASKAVLPMFGLNMR